MKNVLKGRPNAGSIRNVYIIAFVLLLTSYLLTLYANRQIIKQISRVQHTNMIIKTLENLLSKVKDAETSVRGYVITKDVNFLAPYYGSREKTDSFYNEAIRLTYDNPLQQQRLRTLKKDLDTRFDQFSFSISSFVINNMSMSDSMHRLGPEAIRAMDNIRNMVSLMENEEEFLLAEREEKVRETTRAITAITMVSLALAFFLLILGAVTYRQVSRARLKSQQEIADYQSELKAHIDELDKANNELIKMRSLEKLAATGRLARAIAHEVRNPLTNINLAADHLRQKEQKDEESAFLFDMISRNSTRINQLTADLLNSTKFSDLKYEKTAAADLLDEALDEAKDRILLNRVSVVKHYSGSCAVSVDRQKMKVALLNIIINAIEAMETSSERTLTLHTGTKQDKCTITISDTGPGLDKESFGRLFEPYFTSKPNGNGLGLTNTQNIILNHNGDITAHSSLGKGTSFTITLEIAS